MLNLIRRKSVEEILVYGFLIRLVAVIYSIAHDNNISHIKYTDVDYQVFSNGSRALANGESPYDDEEFRYSPLVALFFLPNVLYSQIGKFILIIADIVCGYLQYSLNIQQGTHRFNAKLFLSLWLFNPITIAISTRGSFEPLLMLLVLAFLSSLVKNLNILAGLLYGITIHLKLYPIIYSVALYLYLIQKKPYLIVHSKLTYWLKTCSPNCSHLRLLFSSATSFIVLSYLSYIYYGDKYVDQSFLYHIRRKDLQHNFSLYFFLFRLFPKYQNHLSAMGFVLQAIGILIVTLSSSSFESNRRTKLRKLTFSLFATTFIFVSLNKVCTSQYFTWYFIFLPLILDSLQLTARQGYLLIALWGANQVLWLIFAYLLEYQKLEVLNYVGGSSFLFLASNLFTAFKLCSNFDARGSYNKNN